MVMFDLSGLHDLPKLFFRLLPASSLCSFWSGPEQGLDAGNICLGVSKIGEPNIRKFASGFLFMPLHRSVGVLLDLLQCEQATDQPQLSWETSLRPKARTFYRAGSSRRLRKVWCCGQKHRRILASSKAHGELWKCAP